MEVLLTNLTETIEFLKKEHPGLPKKVFKSLDETKDYIVKCGKKKRCKHCDRFVHYNETLGVWNCDQCDKNPEKNAEI